MKDLRDDENMLIVIQDDGVATAGVLYEPKKRFGSLINVDTFPSTKRLDVFYEYGTTKKGKFDKLVVAKADIITDLTTDDMKYNQETLSMEKVKNTLIDTDIDWQKRSDLLKIWIENYHERIWRGDDDYNKLLEEFRINKIATYPTNGAIFLLKILPLEKMFS